MRPDRPMGSAAVSASALSPVVGGVLCVLTVAVLIWAVAAYNRLVRLRNRADTCWAQIDVQLKRRHDLIPRLVASAHQLGPLDAVVAARGAAMSLVRGAGPAARADAEGALTRALGRLLAAAAADPDLRADRNFAAWRAELADAEDRIGQARRSLAGAVESYNAAVRSLPTGLIAGLGGFRAREFFLAAGEERGPVGARFTGSG